MSSTVGRYRAYFRTSTPQRALNCASSGVSSEDRLLTPDTGSRALGASSDDDDLKVWNGTLARSWTYRDYGGAASGARLSMRRTAPVVSQCTSVTARCTAISASSLVSIGVGVRPPWRDVWPFQSRVIIAMSGAIFPSPDGPRMASTYWCGCAAELPEHRPQGRLGVVRLDDRVGRRLHSCDRVPVGLRRIWVEGIQRTPRDLEKVVS
jgi:hypothetical protein